MNIPCLLFRIEHRQHGNRIMHEFLLGQENIKRDLPSRGGKSLEYEKTLNPFVLSVFLFY